MNENIKKDLETFRYNIDDIDNKIMELLVKRFSISSKIGEMKTINKLTINDPNREEEIINRLSKDYIGALDHNQIASIFSPIYSISKQIQKNK
jgi:chorismate mutase/prephenate dehydratase